MWNVGAHGGFPFWGEWSPAFCDKLGAGREPVFRGPPWFCVSLLCDRHRPSSVHPDTALVSQSLVGLCVAFPSIKTVFRLLTYLLTACYRLAGVHSLASLFFSYYLGR